MRHKRKGDQIKMPFTSRSILEDHESRTTQRDATPLYPARDPGFKFGAFRTNLLQRDAGAGTGGGEEEGRRKPRQDNATARAAKGPMGPWCTASWLRVRRARCLSALSM